MSEAVRSARGTAVWDYCEGGASYPAWDRTNAFTRRHETDALGQVITVRTRETDTGAVSAKIVMITTTPRRTRPSVPPYPFQERVNIDEWLALSEETLAFWDNGPDAVYDDL